MTFTLPANLSFGANTMPISFSATDAAWFDADVVGSATAFDPAAGSLEFLNAGTGEGFVWLGGTVAPTADTGRGWRSPRWRRPLPGPSRTRKESRWDSTWRPGPSSPSTIARDP